MKKTNNKGFSLVELIVVVAIMAVLMIVVAPQLLRYVDKTRQQRDESATAELEHAIEIAIADETIYNSLKLGDGPVTVTAPDDAAFTCSASDGALLAEINLVFPDGEFNYSSAEHDGDTYTITITQAAGSGATISGSWPAPAPTP